jgi:hypothetical protein
MPSIVFDFASINKAMKDDKWLEKPKDESVSESYGIPPWRRAMRCTSCLETFIDCKCQDGISP